MYHHIYSTVWTLTTFLYSSWLSSATWHSANPAQGTNILPGFDNVQNNNEKKKHIKKATFPSIFFCSCFFFFLNGDTTQSTQVVQIVFLHQEQSSEQLWVAVSKFLAYFQREFNNRGITLLSNEYIKAGEQ